MRHQYPKKASAQSMCLAASASPLPETGLLPEMWPLPLPLLETRTATARKSAGARNCAAMWKLGWRTNCDVVCGAWSSTSAP